MKNIVYVSGADHRATAERHFREAETEMLEQFKDMKKGYSAEVDGWKLTLECEGEKTEIDLKQTCQWKVEHDERGHMAVIGFELAEKPHELMFATPVLFDTDTVMFMGMREL